MITVLSLKPPQRKNYCNGDHFLEPQPQPPSQEPRPAPPPSEPFPASSFASRLNKKLVKKDKDWVYNK